MVKFIPVRYKSFDYYPNDDIHPRIQEVTCNLGTDDLEKTTCLDFLSLHTDPSIVWDKWPKKKEKIRNSIILSEFPIIFNNFKNMIDSGEVCFSKLWFNEQWSKEFAGFLVRLTEKKRIKHDRVKIIEIHSPFDKYCEYSLDTFIKRYKIFENEILKSFPSTEIVIENQYTHEGKQRFGKFILSDKDDIIELSNLISEHKSKTRLRIVLDIPQLFSTYYGNRLLLKSEIVGFLTPLIKYRHLIRSTHIWGYDLKNGAHKADLNTYFGGDQSLKKCFIQEIYNLFDDDNKRYFVPEVDHASKIQSIVDDLQKDKDHPIKYFDPD